MLAVNEYLTSILLIFMHGSRMHSQLTMQWFPVDNLQLTFATLRRLAVAPYAAHVKLSTGERKSQLGNNAVGKISIRCKQASNQAIQASIRSKSPGNHSQKRFKQASSSKQASKPRAPNKIPSTRIGAHILSLYAYSAIGVVHPALCACREANSRLARVGARSKGC